jgi:hypothetical protein
VIDPDSKAHDLVMSVFGGMSKGERTRIKIRVRSAMAAQAQVEGRYLGGRPPYGYRVVDARPHPNPAKAAEGKRLKQLEPDPVTAPVVQRIFHEYRMGIGIYALAQHLTSEGIPSPSAYDPDRNKHRCGLAWSKSAVRTILRNPRYTGYQIWNKQRKQESLINVEDVALGHRTTLAWNPREEWIVSDQQVHPALVSREIFQEVQLRLESRGPSSRGRTLHTRHHYAPERADGVRGLWPADAGQLEPWTGSLPVPVPQRVPGGKQNRSPSHCLRARRGGPRSAGHVVG